MKSKNNHLSNRVYAYAVIWCISYTGSLFALKSFDVKLEVGITLTLITLLAFSIFTYKYYRSIFFMDELQIKIHMEAIVIAFSLGLTLLMTLGLLDLFINLNKEDWSYRHIVPYFVFLYFVGLFFSKRKYHFEDEKHD